MRHILQITKLIILCLAVTPLAAVAEPSGTKGQNYDRLVFESATDAEIQVVAKVMTINRFHDSASTLTVTDNGAAVLGPETGSEERRKRTVAIRGKGRHEVLLLCKSIHSDPVYCSLSVDDERAPIAR